MIYAPFTKRDYYRFGVDALIQHGFEVKVWDFSAFLFPEAHQKLIRPDPSDYIGVVVFQSSAQAISEIAKLGHDVFALMIHALLHSPKSFRIFRALTDAKVRYGVFFANSYPEAGREFGWIEMFKRIRRTVQPGFVPRLLMRFPARIVGVNAATVVLVNGAKAVLRKFPFGQETKKLSIHHLDFDLYLEEQKRPNPQKRQNRPNNRVGVFIDGFVPFHSDYILMGTGAPCTAQEYYPLLCRFFRSLEAQNCRIIVAAHPKSRYESLPDYFEGREVIRGKTIELVRTSDFAICHYSTALNFVVLFRKPVMFVTTDMLERSFFKKDITFLSGLLGKNPININHTTAIDIERELTINELKYRNFRHNYIKEEGTQELPLWQVFSRYLRELR